MSNAIEKAGEIIRKNSVIGGHDNPYCVLAQQDTDGMLTASVITPSKTDGIKWLTFCTGLGSNKSKRIERDNRAAVCFDSGEYSITLKGKMEILTDTESKHAHWYKAMENHFSSPDDPDYCVLRFTTEKYKMLVDWEESEGSL